MRYWVSKMNPELIFNQMNQKFGIGRSECIVKLSKWISERGWDDVLIFSFLIRDNGTYFLPEHCACLLGMQFLDFEIENGWIEVYIED